MTRRLDIEMDQAIKNYEQHFNEKAPPMAALMSLPGLFPKYINLLNAAVENNRPIQWDKSIDYNDDSIVY